MDSLDWFGFGFNAFGQICDNNEKLKIDQCCTVKVLNPTNIKDYVDASSCQQDTNKRINISLIRASWSRRASLYSEDDGGVCLSGFGLGGVTGAGCHGCKDAQISEEYVTLAFPDRIESWKTGNNDKTPVWSMDMKTQSEESSETSLYLPLVPGGYIAAKPPLYRPISPQLKAVRLALGADHALLLSATGAMYTWGSGSHGQLGHEVLSSEKEPRAVEALWGLPMSFVAAGGWHSACISAGGDLYVWGWNKSGQLGLPSQTLRKEQHGRRQRPELCQDASTSTCDETQEGGKQSDVFISTQDASTSTCDETQEGGKQSDVFISIQAFPALLDIDPSCEVTKVSCGSRHTAAVTDTGYLYTWGWGDYGQLGHKTTLSSDEPQYVDFFKEKGLRVVDVVCGAWNTFAAAINEEVVTS